MSLPYLQPYLGLSNGLNTLHGGAAGGVGGWVELGRTTLGGTGSSIDVSSLSDKRYYMVLTNIIMNSSGGGSAETIDFDLAGVAFANDDAMDSAVGTAANVSDTWIADDDLHVTSYSSAITIAGSPVAGELVVFQLSRDVATDTLGVDAEVLGVLIEYSTDASNSS